MSKDEMPAKASDTMEEIPEAFAKNQKGYPTWVFELRRTLYCKAKQDPKYRFYTLYSLVCKEEVIKAAWQMVSRNDGVPGVDGVSIDQIRNVAGGEQEFLAGIRRELLAKDRLYKHLQRRSQRPYRCPTGTTWYQHLQDLGYKRLASRLRPCEAL